MKKHIALILALALSVAMFAGCGENSGKETSAVPVPSDVENSPDTTVPPIGTGEDFEHASSDGGREISLDGLRALTFSVDIQGIIYVENVIEVVRIDKDDNCEVLIDGLVNCVGVTVVGDKLYVFEVTGKLGSIKMLRYDLYGVRQDEKEIDLGADISQLYRATTCQNVPVVYIEFAGAADITPLVYSIETERVIQLDIASDYGNLTLLADGRLVGRSLVKIGQVEIISLDNVGNPTVYPAPASFNEVNHYVSDAFEGRVYAKDGDKIVYLKEDSTSVVARSPNVTGMLYFESVCQNRVLYSRLLGNSHSVIVTTTLLDGEIAGQRALRVMNTGSGSTNSFSSYLRYFQSKHPEITVEEVRIPADLGYIVIPLEKGLQL